MNLKHLGLESGEEGALFKIMMPRLLLGPTKLESLRVGSSTDIFLNVCRVIPRQGKLRRVS